MRKAVGASNAILGMHISGWASGKDIAYFNVTDPLGPEVDKVYNFLAPLGLGANVTGATYDVWSAIRSTATPTTTGSSQGQNRWWDASDTRVRSTRRASTATRSGCGSGTRRRASAGCSGRSRSATPTTSTSTTTAAPRQGYKDNRPEYFFGNGTAHIAKFADAGVIAPAVRRGRGRPELVQNDTYTDGQLFMKSRAGAILDAGGVTLVTGGGTGAAGTTGAGGATGAGGRQARAAGAERQAWVAGLEPACPRRTPRNTTSRRARRLGVERHPADGVASSTARAFAGVRSLAVNVAGKRRRACRGGSPTTPAGRVVSFRVWIPSGSGLSSIQPFALQGASGNWAWTGTWRAAPR